MHQDTHRDLFPGQFYNIVWRGLKFSQGSINVAYKDGRDQGHGLTRPSGDLSRQAGEYGG